MEKFTTKILDKIAEGEQMPVIPFCRNIWGYSSLHLLAKVNDVKHANDLLEILSNSPTHHHSLDINDMMGWIIKEQLPNFDDYFNSRLIETD
jgi:hypothetical protein